MAKQTTTNTKTNTATNKTKEYNPTLTALFPNDKFGKGSYLSAPIDGAAYDVIQKTVQLGGRLVFKTAKSKKGADMAFIEVLPPMVSNNSDI
jgi:hypothetical protein